MKNYDDIELIPEAYSGYWKLFLDTQNIVFALPACYLHQLKEKQLEEDSSLSL